VFGFHETIDSDSKTPYQALHNNFSYNSDTTTLTSKPNGLKFKCGDFCIRNVTQLTCSKSLDINTSSIKLEHIVVNDLKTLYTKFPDSVFQVASQFNCLEFPDPYTVPENGVSQYEYDGTQGPTSALICLPATVYRHFYVPLKLKIGQTTNNQINNLNAVELLLNNATEKYFTVKNGYVDATDGSLNRLNKYLNNNPLLVKEIEDAVCVGIQTNMDAVIDPKTPFIISSQVFCSALSCRYSNINNLNNWKQFATIVLKSAYKCTLYHAAQTGVNRVFLTFMGGGAFGNKIDWIVDAMCEAILEVSRNTSATLDIKVCHYQEINSNAQTKINQYLT